jgi:hypothetical protein
MNEVYARQSPLGCIQVPFTMIDWGRIECETKCPIETKSWQLCILQGVLSTVPCMHFHNFKRFWLLSPLITFTRSTISTIQSTPRFQTTLLRSDTTSSNYVIHYYQGFLLQSWSHLYSHQRPQLSIYDAPTHESP